MATSNRKVKDPQDKTVGVSVTRPKWLIEKVDNEIRAMAVELKMDLGHSQVVCALEELMVHNKTIRGLVCAMLKAKA